MADKIRIDEDFGRYGFERIGRAQLQQWAEAVSDDEALSPVDKAYALKLVGEFGDSDDAEHVAEEFSEPTTDADRDRRVAVGRLIDCGYIRVLWTQQFEQRTVFGIVLGLEVWKPEDGEAA